MTASTPQPLVIAGLRLSCRRVDLADGTARITLTRKQLLKAARTGWLDARRLSLHDEQGRAAGPGDWRPLDLDALRQDDYRAATDLERTLLFPAEMKPRPTYDPDTHLVHVPQQGYAGEGW